MTQHIEWRQPYDSPIKTQSLPSVMESTSRYFYIASTLIMVEGILKIPELSIPVRPKSIIRAEYLITFNITSVTIPTFHIRGYRTHDVITVHSEVTYPRQDLVNLKVTLNYINNYDKPATIEFYVNQDLSNYGKVIDIKAGSSVEYRQYSR